MEKYPDNLKKACQQAIHKIESTVGPHEIVDGPPEKTYLTFSLTNGSKMIAYQGGKSLYYSTYKTKCGSSSSCIFYAPFCESPNKGKANHLLISSEPIGNENIWLDLQPKEFVMVDDQLNFEKSSFS